MPEAFKLMKRATAAFKEYEWRVFPLCQYQAVREILRINVEKSPHIITIVSGCTHV